MCYILRKSLNRDPAMSRLEVKFGNGWCFGILSFVFLELYFGVVCFYIIVIVPFAMYSFVLTYVVIEHKPFLLLIFLIGFTIPSIP